MKKILPIAITVCIIATMIASFSIVASAEGSLNVIYKNADTDEIQIYFDDTVNTSELTGNVTLYKKGQEVTINKLLSEAMPSTPTKVSGTALQAPENMVKIQPQDGLELDAVYTLKINSGIVSNEDKILTSDFVWVFKVTELFNDDFEDGSKERWENVLGTANGDDAFNVVDNGLNGMSLQLAPVGGGAYFMPKAANLPYTSSNYTVKYRHSSSTTGVRTYFYSDNRFSWDQKPSYALRFERQSWAANNVYLYSNSGVDLSAYQIGDPELMKVSSKDGTIMVYTNDDTWGLLRSYVATSADTARVVNQGSIAFFVPNGGTALIDDILVTTVVDCAGTTLTVDGGADNALVGTVVEIKFDYPVLQTKENEDCILVSEGSRPIYNYDVSYSEDGKTIYLTFRSNLIHETVYTIEFSEDFRFAGNSNTYVVESQTFTTCMAPIVIESFTLEDGSGEILSPDDADDSLSVEAKISNRNLADSVTCFATVCLYDSEGRMCAIAGNTYTIAKDETATIIDTFDLDGGDDYTVKCFVWQSPDSMKKLLSQTIE